MKKHCVDLKKTGQFSTFFLDYLEGKESLRPFYSHLPNLESFDAAIKAKQFSADKRQILVEVLESQYADLPLSPAAAKQLDALRDEKTFTVTTGPQLHLFTGPLSFIYKLITTINLAKRLQERHPDFHFVPLYWMATEDHDAAEINYFKLDGQTYRWESSQKGAVGDFELDSSFQNFLKGLGCAPTVFRDAYSQSATLAEAVRKYVNELFGAQGLVVLDANDGRLKREFVEVMTADLFTQQPFAAAQASTQALEKLGYGSQIYPRPINLFYLDKGIRERIERDGEEFVVLNTGLRFSAEVISSLLQLLPRNFAVLLSAPIQKKIAQLEWGPEQLFQKFADWKKAFVQASSSFDFSLTAAKDQVAQVFKELGNQSTTLDAGLPKAFAAGELRSLKILEQMGQKLRKAEERRLEVELLRAKSVFEFLSPGGSPQERVVNFMQFQLDHPTLLEKLMACFDPLDFRMQVLSLE